MGRHGTIAGRKEAQDKKRGAIFTKYARLITVAAREGVDPNYNVALKHAIEKAKSINMPNDNIARAIKKGSGAIEGEVYESIQYEGYGPGGVAIIVEILTDNRNRTAAAIKNIFDKCSGNLGVSGCVSYMFDRKGTIEIERTENIDVDDTMMLALDSGADDVEVYDDSLFIITPTESFDETLTSMKNMNANIVEADLAFVPSIKVETLSDEDKVKLTKLIDLLEDNDDVQKVHHNFIG